MRTSILSGLLLPSDRFISHLLTFSRSSCCRLKWNRTPSFIVKFYGWSKVNVFYNPPEKNHKDINFLLWDDTIIDVLVVLFWSNPSPNLVWFRSQLCTWKMAQLSWHWHAGAYTVFLVVFTFFFFWFWCLKKKAVFSCLNNVFTVCGFWIAFINISAQWATLDLIVNCF